MWWKKIIVTLVLPYRSFSIVKVKLCERFLVKLRRKILIRECKRILLDFANAEKAEDAGKKLIENLQDASDFKRHDLMLTGYEYKKLKKLLNELYSAASLLESETIHDFTAYYNAIRPDVEVQYDGTIAENLISEDGKQFKADDVITSCVIKVFSNERNVRLLNKCENEKCRQYFFAKRAKKKGEGGNRFCSDKCRLDFHNRKRIESGEHAAYKRRKRKEGAPESYYG